MFGRKRRQRHYCGLGADEMHKVLTTLCEVDQSVAMTEDEHKAMEIAIQLVGDVITMINTGNRLRMDEDL